jgi:hypothetical protein
VLDLVQKLITAKDHVEQNPGAKVTISLDLNDPKAKKLAALAKKLMLPTTKVHGSGLVTRTGMHVTENAEVFIEELRKVVGDEIVDDLRDDLLAQFNATKSR